MSNEYKFVIVIKNIKDPNGFIGGGMSNKYKGAYKKIFDILDEDSIFAQSEVEDEILKGNDFYLYFNFFPDADKLQKIKKIPNVEILNKNFAKGGLIAPNGKPSNLNAKQYELVRTPAFKKWFGDWENDPANASKVVDENGEPLVVYHGTKYTQQFYDFDLGAISDENVKAFFFSKGYEHAKRYTFSTGSVKAFFLKAIKLFDPKSLSISESKKIRSMLNERVVEDFIEYNYLDGLEEWKSKYDSDMSDKDFLFYILTQTDSSWQVVELEVVQDYLKSNNYNGFITYEQVNNQSTPNLNYAVFEPNQIKLADGINTTFDSTNDDIRFYDGGMIEDLINKGIVELKFYETTPEHAREYGLISKKPIYLQTIFVSENSRLKGVGKQVLDYLENYAKNNGNDLIFGHINNKAQFTKDDRETFFSDVDMIRYWLQNNGYAINEDNNDFHKLIRPNENIRFAKGGKIDFEEMSIFSEELGNEEEFEFNGILVPKKSIYGWIYDEPNVQKKIKNGEYDLVKFRKGLNSIWEKEFQKEHKGSDKLIGIFKGRLSGDNKTLYLLTMTTKPSFKRKGVMSKLIETIRNKYNINKENIVFIGLTSNGRDFFESKKYEKGGFLAPNGNISNLNAEQYELVRTPAFKKWFGDWENDPTNASKVVDENGEPLVVYHGSYNQINKFSVEVNAHYFTNKIIVSETYGKNVLSCFLNIKKPVIWDANCSQFNDIENYINKLDSALWWAINKNESSSFYGVFVSEKTDGVIVKDIVDTANEMSFEDFTKNKNKYCANIYMVSNSNQIKLADGTNTTFDSGNDDIRFEKGGEIDNFIDFYDELKIEDGSKYIGQKFRNVFPFLGKNRFVPNDFRISVKQYEGVLSRLEQNDYSSKIIKQKDLNKLERIKNNIDKKYFLAKFYLDGTGTIVQFKSNEFSKGGRTISQTPAPKKDQVKGSDINKKSSSKDLLSAKFIKFDDKTLDAIKNKVKEHNGEHPDKKINLSSAKAVVRRGFGAYSKSHRPTISGGKPNSRVAWGLARLNAFTYKIVNGKSKSGKYSQDDDLIEELGYKVANYENGGKMKDIRCINCGWEWNRKDSELWDMYVCHKCGFDNTSFYTSDGINRLLKGGKLNSNTGVTPNYLKMFLDL